MKTLKEKYKAVLEGNYPKAEFTRQAKIELPNLISSVNSYDDTVSILKSKGVIEEAKKKEYEIPSAGYPANTLERGVDYELEALGVNTATETPTEEQYKKAREKAIKNLDKDVNYYLNLLASESSKVDKHDQYTEYKDKDKVDTYNGLKKADTKISLKEAFEDEDFERISREIEYNISSERGEEEEALEEEPKMETSVDKTMTLSKVIKIAKLAGEYVPDAEAELKELGVAFGENVPVYKVKNILKKYDLSQIKLREGIHDRDITSASHTNTGLRKDLTSQEKLIRSNFYSRKILPLLKKHNVKIKEFIKMAETDQLDKNELLDLDYVEDRITAHLSHQGDKIDNSRSIHEGRRPKIKGGKVVTENDYETGGYVEAMGEQLDVAIDKVLKVWEKWKNGPATEPGMVPHAKKDLINYFTQKLEKTIEEAEKGSKEEYEEEDYERLSREVEYDTTPENGELNEAQKEKVKNMFKKAIINIFEQDRKLIKEAKTENLERFLHYENENNEDLASRIREGAADLEDVILGIEKNYTSTRSKIEGIYKNIGSFMAPAVAAAFRKDIKPVLEKYLEIKVPKGQRLSPEEMEKLGINSDKTTGTVFALKEGSNTKYTKLK